MKRRQIHPEVLRLQQRATERLDAYRVSPDAQLMAEAQQLITRAIHLDQRTKR